MANFSNISKPGENFYTAFTDFFFFSFVNHRNSQVGPTVCCHKNSEIEKQCSLQLQYSTTPSHVVRLSLVQSVLTTAMHLKVLQKKQQKKPPCPPNSGSKVKTNMHRGALGIVCGGEWGVGLQREQCAGAHFLNYLYSTFL